LIDRGRPAAGWSAPDRKSTPNQALQQTVGAAPKAMTKKILLVDNNPEYRQALASIVRRVGYDVIQAEEIAEAIERSASERPDLVMMAESVEVAAWLKTYQFPVRIPIVIYNSQRTAPWIDEALSNGAAAVLTKPISSADVREVLHKHLQTSRNKPRPIPSPFCE
jgi:CheY-like chemotaxis protein